MFYHLTSGINRPSLCVKRFYRILFSELLGTSVKTKERLLERSTMRWSGVDEKDEVVGG